jgi:hypothetical protein
LNETGISGKLPAFFADFALPWLAKAGWNKSTVMFREIHEQATPGLPISQ